MLRNLLLCVFGLVFTDVCGQVNLSTGVVACYPFSGNANDGSGNGNDGQPSNVTLVNDRFGNPNSAYQFSGTTSSYIRIPVAPIAANRNFTFSTWAYIITNPFDGNSETIISVGPPAASTHYGTTLTNDYSSAGFTGWTMGGFNQDGSISGMTTGFVPPENQWSHVVFTRDDAIEKMYINGSLVTTATNNGSPAYYYLNNSCVAFIGLRSNSTQPFNGLIDDVIIYNRAINAAEVTALYQGKALCSSIAAPSVKPASTCGQGSVSLTATGGTEYNWYDQAGNLLYHGNPYVTPVLVTTTTYLVAQVVNLLEGPRTGVTATVNQPPVVTCNFPTGGDTNALLSFSVQNSGGAAQLTYTFDFGDGVTLTSQSSSATHAYALPGNFNASVLVKDVNLCTGTCGAKIEITDQPPPVVEDVRICGVGSASLFGTNGTQFNWYDSPVGGKLLFEGDPFLTPDLAATTSYYVAGVNRGFESARTKVTVTVLPNPSLLCEVPPTGNVYQTLTFQASETSGTPAFTYQYDFGDNHGFTTASSNVTHEYRTDGRFFVSISVSDANGCTATCGGNVDIKYDLFVPNVITVDADTLNAIFTVYTVADDNYFKYNGHKPFTMTIVNRWGNQVFRTDDSVTGWNGGDVDAGIYYYTIILGEEKFKGWVSVLR